MKEADVDSVSFHSHIPLENFVKFSSDPRLVEVDKLVKSHAKSHIDMFKEVLADPEAKKQYSDFCKTRDTDRPEIGDKIKKLAEYWFMRRDLERYVHLWDSVLKNRDPDIELFTF